MILIWPSSEKISPQKRAGQSLASNLSNEAFGSISSLNRVIFGSLDKRQGLGLGPAASQGVEKAQEKQKNRVGHGT